MQAVRIKAVTHQVNMLTLMLDPCLLSSIFTHACLTGAAAKLSHVAEKFSTFYSEIEQERQVSAAYTADIFELDFVEACVI